MNKYTEQLQQARNDVYDAYESGYNSACWSACKSAYESAYLARKADSNQLDYQINKVLNILNKGE